MRCSYLELGCGHGFGAMLLAASNPAWRVTAVDYNPAHIAAAREWAAEAGLTNIAFIEADLATLGGCAAARPIPEADFVSLHGVWSWVPPAVQAGIVRLLRDKVRPGGAVHVSYNAMPAWGSALGMAARCCGRSGGSGPARSDRQAEDGFEVHPRAGRGRGAAACSVRTLSRRCWKSWTELPDHCISPMNT